MISDPGIYWEAREVLCPMFRGDRSPVKTVTVSVPPFPLQNCPLESTGPVLVAPLRIGALCWEIAPAPQCSATWYS